MQSFPGAGTSNALVVCVPGWRASLFSLWCQAFLGRAGRSFGPESPGNYQNNERGWYRMRRDAILLSAVLSCAFFLVGCGGNGAVSATNAPQTVQLNIVSISPVSVAAGSGNFTLTITGTGLEMSTRVNFGSATLAPSSVAPANCGTTTCEALAVPVPGQDVAMAGAVTGFGGNATPDSHTAALS